jgi:3-deoxy-D-manno-octulosonic-acid transferase
MWVVYNVLFAILYLLALPKYVFRMWRRGGYGHGFMQRLGVYGPEAPPAGGSAGRLWFHAVSVGEVYVALRFMEELRARKPNARFLLTTNTSTGHRVAAEQLAKGDTLLYTPVDTPFVIARFLDRFRPAGLLLVECELWPNMVRMTAERGVPVALLNGRLSDSSFRGYRMLRPVFRVVLRAMRLLLVQSEEELRRLVILGAEADRILVTGSAKYDGVVRDLSGEKSAGSILERCGLGRWRRLLVGGSTWPGEEEVLLRCLASLRSSIPDLKMILVPRHVERSDEVEKAVAAAGFRCARRSGATPGEEADVLLVDTTGELRHYYAFGEVIFVGKSLTRHGGQNIIEAGCAGRAIVVGPHMENFPVILQDFQRAGAIVQVKNEADLLRAFEDLFGSPEKALGLGRKAAELVESRRGVVRACVDKMLAEVPAWR